MGDILTIRERSVRMRLVRSKNTKPEIAVRKLLSVMGYRYRMHSKDLPGRPDIAFPSRKKVVFVHGCFWHQHENCRLGRMPKSRLGYWRAKLEANSRRDARHVRELRQLGWRALVIWECQLVRLGRLAARLERFLDVRPQR